MRTEEEVRADAALVAAHSTWDNAPERARARVRLADDVLALLARERDLCDRIRKLADEARAGAKWREAADNPNTGRYLIEDRAVAVALHTIAADLGQLLDPSCPHDSSSGAGALWICDSCNAPLGSTPDPPATEENR